MSIATYTIKELPVPSLFESFVKTIVGLIVISIIGMGIYFFASTAFAHEMGATAKEMIPSGQVIDLGRIEVRKEQATDLQKAAQSITTPSGKSNVPPSTRVYYVKNK